MLTSVCVSTVKEAMRIFVGLTSADGYDAILSHLGDDPQVCACCSPLVQQLMYGAALLGGITASSYVGPETTQ